MKTTNIIRITVCVFLIAGIATAVIYRKQFNVAALESWLAGAGVVAPLLFIGIYAISTVLCLPGSVLTIAGGVLFGPIWGTFYNLTGATIGATMAFLIARYLASNLVSRKTGGRLRQLIDGVEAEGWRFVAFVRLVPLFPFNLLNYALGLTRIRLFHYVVTSYICMLPGAIAYTYLGYAGRNAVAGGEGMIPKALLGLGLLAFVSFLPRLIKRLRKKPLHMLSVAELKQRLDKGDDILVLDVRGAEEYVGDLGHIRGSRNIAIEDLPRHLDELKAYRQRPIVIVCRTDRRSMKAAQMLIQAGFSNITVLRGGMKQWNRNRLPVVR
ncbi:MAG: VTT domain-containing protein [Planctomycetes bacterium]|uniref:VTT domain-containing protein n=1 Tax=Candidatus Wunengus sp. YC65 TaxID=3367701 RepID=UPI001DFD7745|nr:VTT domain-containing protein [Planctomycetota bacterium]